LKEVTNIKMSNTPSPEDCKLHKELNISPNYKLTVMPELPKGLRFLSCNNVVASLDEVKNDVTRDKFELYVKKKNEDNPDRLKIAMSLFNEDPVTAIQWYAPDILKKSV
jgi:hypothetical protein